MKNTVKTELLMIAVTAALVWPTAASAVDIAGQTPAEVGRKIGNCSPVVWRWAGSWLPCWYI